MNPHHLAHPLWLASAALLVPAAALAQDNSSPPDPRAPLAHVEAIANPDGSNVVRNLETGDIIYVYGRGERRIGTAGAASEGGVAGADLRLRPLLRPGELLEATPGLMATQHSGGGKANQFFLRGYNLDHGTDYAVYIDDMPMNLRTHGHGQGYLDVNGLIPEAVARVDYRKGPYRADTGDFSFVGASFITTRDRIDPFLTAEIGAFGYRRLVGGGSVPLGAGDLLAIGQIKLNDGPWELPEDFEGYSALLKYSAPLAGGEFHLSYNLFDASWNPTEQIPERVIGTPLCEDAFCTLDGTQNGFTRRHILTAGFQSERWRLTAYAQRYDWELLSNFTFFLDDPVNGDQLRQYSDQWTYGGRIEHTLPLSESFSLRIGGEARHDDIARVGLDETIAGVKEFTVGAFGVGETSLGLYAEAIWRPAERVMIIGGLRQDWYRFQTRALEGEASWDGNSSDNALGFKIGANVEVAPGLALYANHGEGFHSNDARGVTNPDDPAPGLVEGDFQEVGLRLERGGLIFSAVYWWSAIESELIYVGDAGAVEPNDPSTRRGYELTAFYKPNNWLAFDAVWTGSRARFVGLPEGENHLPGALDSAGELGVSAIFPSWNAAARLRYLGPAALIEDNSVRSDPTVLVNLRLAFTPARLGGFAFHAELLNLFNARDRDITYFYETRFPGEPEEGVAGINSRIVEPRQLRLGVTRRF